MAKMAVAGAVSAVRELGPVQGVLDATGEGRDYSTAGPLVVEQQADVVAERDGRITSVNAEIGEHVRRGEGGAEIDCRGSLADAALLIRNCDDLTHVAFSNVPRGTSSAWVGKRSGKVPAIQQNPCVRERDLNRSEWSSVTDRPVRSYPR